jgi:rfaE bifunctional protein kinase chain/domain
VSITAARLTEFVASFPSRNVVVAGDFVGDEYLLCRTSRISREAAAALVLTYERRELRLGGGANAVANIRALGGTVEPVGVVGEDEAGGEICDLMHALKVPTEAVLREPRVHTVVKTRVMTSSYHATKQMVLRIDRESFLAPDAVLRHRLEATLAERVERADALLVADYGYGSGEPGLVAAAIAAARRRGIPVCVDSRHRLCEFQGVSAATPNEEEVEEALGGIAIGDDQAALAAAGEEIRRRLGAEAVVVTRGARGMALCETSRPLRLIEVYGSDEVADVTGAGDTVIAAFTLALASGASYEEAAHLANYAGGLVVMKRGTATVSAAELVEAVRNDLG